MEAKVKSERTCFTWKVQWQRVRVGCDHRGALAGGVQKQV